MLEDLHWSDAATVAALAGFGLRREAAKLVVIGTYRWEILTSYSHHTYTPYSAQQAAIALLRLGQFDAARAMLTEGFVQLEQSEARWCEAELHRSQGEIAAAVAATQRRRSKARLQATAEAEDCFRRAIDVASAQGARWWELRARFSLARQLAADERAEAMQHLRDLHAAVDDDIDVAKLHAIRAFLKQTTDEPSAGFARNPNSSPAGRG